jgi:ElaB/YqjD/DUF883 family membrane-anchored ribosome-binding protein
VNDQQRSNDLPEPKSNGSRRPVQIMAEINRTREEMDETLSAIERRLTPGQLVDQGIDYLKNSGAREYASNLGNSLKTNPLPATLAGIGIAWLMAVGNRQSSDMGESSTGPGMGDRMQSAKDKLTGSMESAKDSVTGKMQSAKDSVGNRVQSAKESLTSGAQSARETASRLTDTASQQIDRARENWDYILREHPLVIGAVGAAIGAVFGALAPRTRKEDELMGEARDNLVDQAKQAGSAKLEQAKQAASSVKDAAADAAQRQAGDTGKEAPKGKGDGKTEWPYPTAVEVPSPTGKSTR